MNAPSSTPGAGQITLDQLVAKYGGRWTITTHESLPVLVAEHRSQSGRSVRVIVAHNPGELAAKLATAETVEP